MGWNGSAPNITLRSGNFSRKWKVGLLLKGDCLIADSLEIQRYLLDSYQKESVFIPYGAVIPTQFDPHYLDAYQLKPEQYFLAVARLVPENNLETIIKGHLESKHDFPLVLIGNANHQYGAYLKKKYPFPNIKFIGGVYEVEALNTLRHYAKLYFHGHSVGGTNPSLLEAMACQCWVVAHKNPFNESVLGPNGFYFDTVESVAHLIKTPQSPELKRTVVQQQLEKVNRHYQWDSIIDQYEALFASLVAGESFRT